MKKILLLLAFAGTLSFQGFAQHLGCAATTDEDLRKDPEYARNHQELEQYTQQFIQMMRTQRTGATRTHYVIPVVFHIIHDYGAENISDAQVYDAVSIMTRDWNKMNADTVDVIPQFASNIATMDVEFRLATIDPNGNCTNGIDRVHSTKTYNADDGSKLNPWPCNKYVNIWVVHSLANAGAAAYAYYPGGQCTVDGIISRYDYVGSIGTSSILNSRTLTHEMGHVFNLEHPWGNTNQPNVACGDDGVADTPITKGWDHCPTPNAANICDTAIVENYQNYMDYSYCDRMFTNGQKARMLAAMTSGVSGRNNLWSTSNLAATGTDGSPVTICYPVADFKSDFSATCSSDSVHYIDQSWKAPIVSWNWSFPGGIPSTSTDSNPTVIYPVAGVYNSSLKVYSSAGSDSITKMSIMHVTDTAMSSFPYSEDFENASSFPGIDGWVVNHDGDVTTWTRATNASVSPGTSSMRINNFSNTSGYVDDWITPSIDLSNVNAPVYINFSVANAQGNASSNDALKLYYSIDCGRSWHSTSYSKTGAALSTAGVVLTNFTPTSTSQWRQESVAVNSVKLKPNVRFKFENTSDSGNNTYIDNINMTGNVTGIDETAVIQSSFTIYPNPTSDITTVNFYILKTNDVKLDVKDILGHTVSTVINEKLEAGMHEYKLPVLSSGIYLIDLSVNNKHIIRKLVVS